MITTIMQKNPQHKSIKKILFMSIAFILVLTGIAHAESRLFVANSSLLSPLDTTLGVIRLSDHALIANIPLTRTSMAHSVAVHPNGLKAYVTGIKDVPSGRDGAITIVDTKTNAVTGIIPTTEHAAAGIAFTPTGADAYVCMNDDDVVRRINTATNSIVGPPIVTHTTPLDIVITADGKKAYVAANFDGFIDIIDLTTSPPAVTKSIDLSSNNLQSLAFNSDQSYLYVTDAANNIIKVIRTSDDVEVTPVFMPIISAYPRALSISADNAFAFVGMRMLIYADSVLVINLSNGNIVQTIHDSTPLGCGIGNPRRGVLSPDGSYFYVSCHGCTYVAAINTSNYSYTYIPSGGANPVGLALGDVPTDLPASVPTMTEWGMIAFALLAGLSSAYYLRRRETP